MRHSLMPLIHIIFSSFAACYIEVARLAAPYSSLQAQQFCHDLILMLATSSTSSGVCILTRNATVMQAMLPNLGSKGPLAVVFGDCRYSVKPNRSVGGSGHHKLLRRDGELCRPAVVTAECMLLLLLLPLRLSGDVGKVCFCLRSKTLQQ